MWQKDTIEEALNFFKKENGVKALILIGSFANEGVKINEWRDVDFVICYIWPWKTFYIIPNDKKTWNFTIRDGESKASWAGTNHEEHKEAWHLLE